MTEDIDGNIWAVCLASLESSYVYAISRYVKSFQRRKFQWGDWPGSTRRESGLALALAAKGDVVLFRDGVQKRFATGSAANLRTITLLSRQTVPSSPPSITGSSEFGRAKPSE